MSQKQADYAGVRHRYPAVDTLKAADWVAVFQERPDVLHKLLGDLYAITKAQQDETRKSGRRTKHINGTLDELWDMLTPRYSTEPFEIAIRDVMGTQSVRAFAMKIPMHHRSFRRYMMGERRIVNPLMPEASMEMLESIAKAGNVHPAFFAEWRELAVLAAIQQGLRAQPDLSIQMTYALFQVAE
jgi:hypothetical protein